MSNPQLNEKNKKGIFITFEGADGSGKSTQLKLVQKWLIDLGYDVVCTREPGGTNNAEKLRNVVLDPQFNIGSRTETLLYLASRAEHIRELIKPALNAKKIVLCDRFSDSTFVYQGIVRGLGLENIKNINEFATEGIAPELTILLDANPNDLLLRREQRGSLDRLELEGINFQLQVREGFLALAQLYPNRIKTVDANGQEQEVFERIKTVISAIL